MVEIQVATMTCVIQLETWWWALQTSSLIFNGKIINQSSSLLRGMAEDTSVHLFLHCPITKALQFEIWKINVNSIPFIDGKEIITYMWIKFEVEKRMDIYMNRRKRWKNLNKEVKDIKSLQIFNYFKIASGDKRPNI